MKKIIFLVLMVTILTQGAFALSKQSISAKTSYPLMVHEEYDIKAKAKTSVSYKSSNGHVKVINGRLIGVSKGSSVITIKAAASSKYKSATKKVKVIVKKYPRSHAPQKYGWYQPGRNPYSAHCTWYSWGRFAEIRGGYPSKLCKKGVCASKWYDTTGYKKGKTPKLGAAIIFNGPNGGVAGIVEKVYGNGDIKISTTRTGSKFTTLVLRKSKKYSIGRYTLKGFIYQ